MKLKIILIFLLFSTTVLGALDVIPIRNESDGSITDVPINPPKEEINEIEGNTTEEIIDTPPVIIEDKEPTTIDDNDVLFVVDFTQFLTLPNKLALIALTAMGISYLKNKKRRKQ